MPVENIVIGQKVSYEMRQRAKQLRREMTPAERILWKELRNNKLNGLHFRRQQIIDSYIAAFYCHQHAVILEVDGCIHELQQEYDGNREEYLIARGFCVLHLTNEEVFGNLQPTLNRVQEACSYPRGQSRPSVSRKQSSPSCFGEGSGERSGV